MHRNHGTASPFSWNLFLMIQRSWGSHGPEHQFCFQIQANGGRRVSKNESLSHCCNHLNSLSTDVCSWWQGPFLSGSWVCSPSSSQSCLHTAAWDPLVSALLAPAFPMYPALCWVLFTLSFQLATFSLTLWYSFLSANPCHNVFTSHGPFDLK